MSGFDAGGARSAGGAASQSSNKGQVAPEFPMIGSMSGTGTRGAFAAAAQLTRPHQSAGNLSQVPGLAVVRT